jgi:predicted metalloprotease with PDZ domain
MTCPGRRSAALPALLVLLSPLCLPAHPVHAATGSSGAPDVPAAVYDIRVDLGPPPRITVRATLPSDGDRLTMATSRPGNVPEVAGAGWPGLVRGLKVTDDAGHALRVAGDGAKGWTLAYRVRGSITLEYAIDDGPLARRGWPAPREAGFADADHLIAAGRSLFITTPAQRASEVRFTLPPGWRAVLPWAELHGGQGGATVPSTDDLTENLIAFMRGEPDLLPAGGFNLKVVTLGHWQPAREEVRRVLGTAIRRLVAWIGFEGEADYLVVLLPQEERGGESYTSSFALNFDGPPGTANLGDWGNTVAHEVFHHWNGWLLRGADYASTQWFQEGFTEYAANLALVSGGLISPEDFYARLATHVANFRRLATPLDAPGTHKGPPLYSGGALVAFTWDGMIHAATHGRRGVGDVLHALLRATGDGARPYAWPDIQAALESVAPGASGAPAPWADFQRRYIHGKEPLPLDAAFARIGLRLSQGTDGAPRVEVDPAAPATAVELRKAMLGVPGQP